MYPGEETREELDGGTDAATLKKAAERAWAGVRSLPPEVWVFLFYLAAAVALTWPVASHFTTSIYGKPGDNLGAVWLNWWYKNHAAFGGTTFRSGMIGYPFYTPLWFPYEPLWYLEMRFLLLFVSAPVAWNIDICFSFFLSGVTMYYLVKYLADDRGIAFFGGFAYLVGVFHAYYAMWIGGGLAATQWMPLYILLLLKFIRRPSWKSSVLLALSGVLVASTSIHFGFFMAIFTAAFLVGRFLYAAVVAARERGTLRGVRTGLTVNRRTLLMSLAALLIVLLCVMPLFTLFVLGANPSGKWPTSPTVGELRARQFIYYNAAVPGEYLLPNKLNPVLGPLAEGHAGTGQPDFGNAIYVGWVAVTLSLVCALLWRRRGSDGETGSGRGQAEGETSGSGRFAAGALWGFALAGLTAFVLSLRPHLTVGSVEIPLPSKLFSVFVPWLRWYSRLAIVVSICLVVIACFGLARLTGRLRLSAKGLVIGLALALVAFETVLVPPGRNFSFSSVPPVFKAIGKMPRDTAFAFYPIKESGPFVTSRLMFYQTIFQRPMLNGGTANSDGEAMRRTVYNPYNPATPGVLRRIGIDYMVFFMGRVEGTDAQWQDPGLLPPGLEEAMRFNGSGTFRYGRLYRITAPPALVVPLYLGDISVPYIGEGGATTRLVDRDGRIGLLNYSGRDLVVTFRLPVANPFTRREIVIERQNGEVLWRAVLEQGQVEVAQVEGLLVPRDGLDLRMRVYGRSFELSYQDLTIYAASRAAFEISDVEISCNR